VLRHSHQRARRPHAHRMQGAGTLRDAGHAHQRRTRRGARAAPRPGQRARRSPPLPGAARVLQRGAQGDVFLPQRATRLAPDARIPPPRALLDSDAMLADGSIVADRFRITGTVGAGPHGIVYRADDAGTTVALKVVEEPDEARAEAMLAAAERAQKLV